MRVSELWLRKDLARAWAGQDPFAVAAGLNGQLYRAVENRRTLRFRLDGVSYFVKYHRGVSWREILKNLVQLRLPVVSAHNEWKAIARLGGLEIPTLRVAGYGRRGWLPGRIESFLITEDLGDPPSLETLCADWVRDPPDPALKRCLIEQVAGIARRMHDAGMCHRDFYLCHFLLMGCDPPRLCLIDLHRALIRRRLSRRWKIKDVGGLYFSALGAGLGARDRLRFMRHYSDTNLHETLRREADFWKAVRKRASRMQKRDK